MLPTACPKPKKRSPLPRSTKPVKKRNEARIARKAKAYGKLIRSDFNLRLRYARFQLSKGDCECDRCVAIRTYLLDRTDLPIPSLPPLREITPADIEYATQGPNVWFTKTGGAPHKRFRSTEGQLHHLRYGRTEREDPRAIDDVRWMHAACHARVESEHPTRRRYLKGGR